MNRAAVTAGWGRWLLVVGFLCPVVVIRADEPPPWLRKVAGKPLADVPADVPATVLLNETVLAIDVGGRATWEHRYAVRILTRAGLPDASGSAYYLDKKDTVIAAEAWLLRGGKVAKTENQNKWYDWSAAAQGAIYDETRAKQISFQDDAVPGDIFACETQVEGPMLFDQEIYAWDSLLPVAVERYVVTVPSGWSVTSLLQGPTQPVASVSPDKRTWTWELRDRPYRPLEPWMYLHGTVEAQLMVNLISTGGATKGSPRVFRTWSEVADWEAMIATGQCDTDPALAAIVRRLVADCSDQVEKIRALASYVQKLRYVAVNIDLARGLGYRPRKASEVFAKGFGDCKDKSNLLRAMLREAGILSYPVAALSSGEREVYDDWPSPFQFNHAILAIQVDGNVNLPTVAKTRQWGPLLFFDSTDPETLLGDLPWYLQGSKVQVIAPGSNELIRLPELPVERRWLEERRASLILTVKGSVSGECHFTGYAQAGAQVRRTVHKFTVKELHDWATGHVSAAIQGASAQNVVCNDDPLTGQFGLAFSFPETGFAQMMPGGLSVVRLDILNRDSIPTFAESERRTPVELRPIIQDDEVTLALPSGFEIEELPAKTIINSPYGSYENSFESGTGSVVFHRTLKLSPLIVPVADYPKLRQFLSSVSKADRGALILRSAK